jgi:hypothetical protein
MAVITNKPHKTAITLDIASGSYQLANFANASVTETVSAAAINQIFFSSNGAWTVARGANTVAVLTGSGHWNLSGMGLALGKDSTANVVLTLSASSVGSIMIEFKKTTTPVTEYV